MTVCGHRGHSGARRLSVSATSGPLSVAQSEIKDWLRAHHRLPGFTTLTPAQRASARLTGLQLVRARALMPGILGGMWEGGGYRVYEGQAP